MEHTILHMKVSVTGCDEQRWHVVIEGETTVVSESCWEDPDHALAVGWAWVDQEEAWRREHPLRVMASEVLRRVGDLLGR